MKQGKSIKNSILAVTVILSVFLSSSCIAAAYYGNSDISAINGLTLLLVGSVFAVKKLKKSPLDTVDLEAIQVRLKRL